MATQCREQQRKRKNKIATIRAYAMLVVVVMIGSIAGFFISPRLFRKFLIRAA